MITQITIYGQNYKLEVGRYIENIADIDVSAL